jgi:hypothetical protein
MFTVFLTPLVLSCVSVHSVVPLIATGLSLASMIMVVVILWTTIDMGDRFGTTDLTAQEWWWRIQEGYWSNMLNHYFHQ